MDPITATLTNLANTISARVVHNACPVCDTENWTHETSAAIPVQWAVPRADGGFGVQATGNVHLAVAFVCLNCGYMRWHMPPLALQMDAMINPEDLGD
jgi:predicted RNA-binding Zn-ribbon protein involved in translation (DUF1610 family)